MPDTKAAPDDITVTKRATCPTLSGGGKLHYQFGLDPNGTIHIRITENSGGGHYSDEWVSLTDVWASLERNAGDGPSGTRPITAIQLQHLFRGRSVNTPAFLLAVLIANKVLQRIEGRKRGLQRNTDFDIDDAAAFLRLGMTGVTAGKKRLVGSKPKAPAKKKAPVKKTGGVAKPKTPAKRPAAKRKAK